jgi:hypothetical protein
MSSRWVAVICGAMVLGGAAPASALTAYVNYDSLVISAAAGEKNYLTIQHDPAGRGPSPFLIVESGLANVKAGPGCRALGRVIRCTLGEDYATPSLSLSLRDGNDTATVDAGFYLSQVDAGAGDDRVDISGGGGFGWSSVNGGPGRDDLDTQNGVTEHVDCGSGADTIAADPFDELYGC